MTCLSYYDRFVWIIKYEKISYPQEMYYSINSMLITISFLFSMFRLPKLLRSRDCIALSEPKFKKLVYLIVDGLRFDGFVPVDKKGDYFNNINFARDSEKLRTTFMSVASIPTVTKCRIIGLMTGAPNNQIEELMSFFMSKVDVDALPDKFADRKMKFYGDDLWIQSFDVLKGRASTFCGLSKKSLEENELALIEEIKRDKDYEIRFIHIISLDALGHIYGINHPRIKQALKRVDRLVSEIYESIDDDTLFVVTSDHGVTDKGAHGGSSPAELSSFCGFYSKRNIPMFNDSESIYNAEFINKFYDTKDVNTKNDWIKALNPYKIIQQDDILPTVSYFMGVSTPTNTYGNLIPYLVDDMKAQKILAEQKHEILKEDIEIKNEDSFIERNYKITKTVYEKLSKTYPVIAFASLALGVFLLGRIYSQLKDVEFFSLFTIVFSIIMVSHSYWSFSSEDYVWGLVYLLNNFSLSNMVFVAAYFVASGRDFLAYDKVTSVILRTVKNDTLYSIADIIENYKMHIFVFLMVLFFISKQKNQVFIKNCTRMIPQLVYLLYSKVTETDYESRISFLCSYPSIESMMIIHLKPTIAILLGYFLNNLDVRLTQSNRFILLQLTTFIVDIEKTIQTIDYNVFFALSDIYGSISNYTGVLSYLILPRYLVARKIAFRGQGRFLSMFEMLFCYACSWFMRITIVFQNFFIGRLIFTIIFFYTDIMIELGMSLQKRCLGTFRMLTKKNKSHC